VYLSSGTPLDLEMIGDCAVLFQKTFNVGSFDVEVGLVLFIVEEGYVFTFLALYDEGSREFKTMCFC
jgi:hypothetical protein